MKKLFLLLGVALLATTPMSAQEQRSQKEINKEVQALLKMSDKQLNEKASKDARKEAKRLAKEGWVVGAGELPLEKMLDRSYQLQYQYGEDLLPKYILGDGKSIGENYNAAKAGAEAAARLSVAGAVESNITALINTKLANGELGQEEAVSLAQTVAGSKNLIQENLPKNLSLVRCYRVFPNKNQEARIIVFFDVNTANKAAAKALKEKIKEDKRAELDSKADELIKSVDKLLGF